MAKSPNTDAGHSSRASKSKWLSIAASVGLIVIVGACCLCGGAVWQKQPSFESDPKAAVALTQEILPITVPPVFTPEGTIQWDLWAFLEMRGAYYSLSTGEGELSFLEVDGSFIDNAEFRDHIKTSLQEHGAGGGFDLALKGAETKSYDVDGEAVDFQFLKAEDRTTGRGRRLVDGIVNRPQGPVMISLWVDEENWDPQMVDDMLASIGNKPTGDE